MHYRELITDELEEFSYQGEKRKRKCHLTIKMEKKHIVIGEIKNNALAKFEEI